MPLKSKGITSHYPLKMTPEERALLEQARQVYKAGGGMELSLNDMVRHLIRRAGMPLGLTPDETHAQIAQHASACPDCELEAEAFRCPDGFYLYRNHRRVLRAHSGADLASAL